MDTQVLSPLRKSEIIGGFICLPMCMIGTPLLLSLLLTLCKVDMTAGSTLLWLNMLNELVNLLVVLLVFHRFLRGQLTTFQGSVGRIIGTIAIGYAIAYAGGIAVNLLRALLSTLGLSYSNVNQDAVSGMVLSQPLLTLPMIVVCAPIVEETFFRGLIFGLLHRKSRFWAYAVSMTAFSVLHVYSSALSGEPWYSILLSFLTYLPFGFALAWVFERCRSLWGAIILHALNNLIAVGSILLLDQLSGLIGGLPF